MSGSDPRSQRLLAWKFTGVGYSPAFTCPDGFVVLVKSADLFNNSAVEGDLVIAVVTAGNAVYVEPFRRGLTAAQGTHIDCWIVLNPGDLVTSWAAGAGFEVWISGAVLRGPVPLPVAETAVPLFTYVPPADVGRQP